MIGLYVPGDSALHRLSAGPKLLALAAAGTSVMFVADWPGLAVCLGVVFGLWRAAGIPVRTVAAQLRPALWVLLALFAMQTLSGSWQAGLTMTLRFAALILLAALITATTPVSAMIVTLETVLRPLARLGLDPGRISFTVSMALRFIPVLVTLAAEVREAQRARGAGRNLFALTVPLILRTLQMADHVAEAVEARSYDPTVALHAAGATGCRHGD